MEEEGEKERKKEEITKQLSKLFGHQALSLQERKKLVLQSLTGREQLCFLGNPA